MTRGDDVAQNLGPTEPKWVLVASLTWSASQGLVYFRKPFHTRVKEGCWSGSVTPNVSATRKLGCLTTLASRPVWQVGPLSPTFGQSTDLTLLYIPTYSSRQKVWRKWGLASFSAPKFILCRVERGEVLRAGGLPGLSGVLGVARAWKICRNPFRFNGVFRALVRSSAGALPEFYELWQRADSQVPLLYRDSSLSGNPWHYLRVGDLPIIVSHSFASLMLFVHLHTVQ
jgi:hypothetical protein